jgi:hypothetical protein
MTVRNLSRQEILHVFSRNHQVRNPSSGDRDTCSPVSDIVAPEMFIHNCYKSSCVKYDSLGLVLDPDDTPAGRPEPRAQIHVMTVLFAGFPAAEPEPDARGAGAGRGSSFTSSVV